MHIDTVNINLAPSPLASALLSAIMARSAEDPSADARTPALTPPAIGEIWPGQGGIYAGLSRGEDGAPDAHLVLHVSEPESKLDWEDAMAWAQSIEVDGHKDFHLPTRFESALLYANLRDLMDHSGWYWTSTQYAGNESYAWFQYFTSGNQLYGGKSYEGRARAVRRLTA